LILVAEKIILCFGGERLTRNLMGGIEYSRGPRRELVT
jgi:hypothetical protein